MKKLKKILIATDFSKKAQFALERAAEFARLNKARLTILHVFPKLWIDKITQWFTTSPTKEFKKFKADAQKIFNKKIKPSLKDISTNFLVELGREDKTIIDCAKTKKAQLLVIGAHGDYHLHEYFLGTTAGSIIKNVPCPVLIVKKRPGFNYSRILLPIDFSMASKTTLHFALQHFPNAKITLLHVEDLWYEKNIYRPSMEKTREALLHKEMRSIVLEKMEDFIQSCNVAGSKKLSYEIRGGYPAIVIAKTAKEKKSNLIIIGTRGQGDLYYTLLGSTAERVIREVTTDVIAVPPDGS